MHPALVDRKPQRVADACHALRFDSGTNPGIADIEKHHRDRFHRHDYLDAGTEVLEIGMCMGAPVGHTLGPDARQQVPARKRRIASFPFLPDRQRDATADAEASGLLPPRPDGTAEVHRRRPDKTGDELCPARSDAGEKLPRSCRKRPKAPSEPRLCRRANHRSKQFPSTGDGAYPLFVDAWARAQERPEQHCSQPMPTNVHVFQKFEMVGDDGIEPPTPSV